MREGRGTRRFVGVNEERDLKKQLDDEDDNEDVEGTCVYRCCTRNRIEAYLLNNQY